MKATTLWVVFTLFIVIYQVSALPLAPPKEEDVKSGDVPKQDKEVKEQDKEQENKEDDDDDTDSSADEEPENESEDVDSESNGSASADEPEDKEKERDQRSAEESGESSKAVAQKKSKGVSAKRCCGCCGCCGGHHPGGSWGVCDLCHHPCGEGWCGAGCQCANCCGGFGHPVTNHGCNGGCCPSVTFPCTFGACVNNPCCECCREPAPPGKCKWPCLWPCCCECTPPKFKFKPLKPKPVCHCPHNCCGHKRSAIAHPGQYVAPFVPVVTHPYGYSARAFIPSGPYAYRY